MSAAAAPQLRALYIADPPERWQALGFRLAGGEVKLGGVRLALGRRGHGITAWELHGVGPAIEAIDGLATDGGGAARGPALAPPPEVDLGEAHPNGALAVDHVVVTTPDFERTSAALERVGMSLRRVRRLERGLRQGFRRLGPAILEVVEAPAENRAEPARFWGMAVAVEDLEALARRLGSQLVTAPRAAVQPGRRIATVREAAALTTAVAFITPDAR